MSQITHRLIKIKMTMQEVHSLCLDTSELSFHMLESKRLGRAWRYCLAEKN